MRGYISTCCPLVLPLFRLLIITSYFTAAAKKIPVIPISDFNKKIATTRINGKVSRGIHSHMVVGVVLKSRFGLRMASKRRYVDCRVFPLMLEGLQSWVLGLRLGLGSSYQVWRTESVIGEVVFH